MITYTQKELNKILNDHKLWLEDKGGQCADFNGANLSGANLQGVDLTYADLDEANLNGANLSGANLHCADLDRANLSNVNLSNSNLYYANIRCANLTNSNLSGANLYKTNFRGSNLRDVKYNENTAFYALQCPEKGSFVAYKKICDSIVELEIPADAKRSSATTRKCRCNKAMVLGIYDLDGNLTMENEIKNHKYGIETLYRVGEMVYPDSFDEDRWNECSHGIHFFTTFKEAVNYHFL